MEYIYFLTESIGDSTVFSHDEEQRVKDVQDFLEKDNPYEYEYYITKQEKE